MPRHEGVATARHKLIRFPDLKGSDGQPLIELYDLDADPDERTSLAGRPESAALESEMRHRLDAIRELYRAP